MHGPANVKQIMNFFIFPVTYLGSDILLSTIFSVVLH